MNKEWSEMNKTLQLQIKRKDTFATGIDTLLELRRNLMEQIVQFRNELADADFYAMPYMNAKGYHNKTIAYSLWHIFRIEDIVAHSLIANDEQIFFKGDYQSRIKSPIVTTANELVKEEDAEEFALDHLGITMKPLDKHGAFTQEQIDCRCMNTEWYFSDNWIKYKESELSKEEKEELGWE